MLGACNDAENGHLPVAGGMLDQTQAFIESSRLIRSERAHYQNNKPHG